MLASRAPVRASILQLPPHLRVTAYQQTQSRAFSASSLFEGSLVEAITAPSSALLDGLHAIGTPWSAAIPITAILVRGVIGHYVGGIPAQRRAQARNNVLPLVTAELNVQFRDKTSRGDYDKARDPAAMRRIDMFWARLFKLQRVGRKFGGALVAPSSLINFGTFIATTEALRMKCGSREGLLPLLLGPFKWVGQKVAPSLFSPVDAAQVAGEKYAARIEEIRQARLEGGSLSQGSENALAPGDMQVLMQQEASSAAPPHVDTSAPHFDPTMQTEGFLFSPDLTLPDPTGTLPVALLSVMMARILLRPNDRPIKSGPPITFPWRWLTSKYSKLQMFGVSLSGLFIVVTAHMPAGIVLYFACSAAAGMVQRRWLDARMPLRPAIQACKRPTRVKAKKLWADVR